MRRSANFGNTRRSAENEFFRRTCTSDPKRPVRPGRPSSLAMEVAPRGRDPCPPSGTKCQGLHRTTREHLAPYSEGSESSTRGRPLLLFALQLDDDPEGH